MLICIGLQKITNMILRGKRKKTIFLKKNDFLHHSHYSHIHILQTYKFKLKVYKVGLFVFMTKQIVAQLCTLQRR